MKHIKNVDGYIYNWNKNESKISAEKNRDVIKCSCSNKIPRRAFKEREREVLECNWCHKLVYLDPIKQEEYEERYKKEMFDIKLKKYMKASEKNEIIKRGKRNSRKS